MAGVPCSGLAGPVALLTSHGRYVAAANEGAALAMAAGAAAAGRRSAVMSQNSGLGNLINPLTSLAMPYGIPVLCLISMRGWPDPAADEPQHSVMGPASAGLIAVLGLAAWTLGRDASPQDFHEALDGAAGELDRGRPAFLLMGKGFVGPAGHLPAPPAPPVPSAAPMARPDVLKAISPLLAGLPVVATTGYTARELFAIADADEVFYMQGSMGHAPAFALGLALRRPGPVVVLDGDGALLMHLGTTSTIGAAAPVDVVHVVFDNGCYESTGAQLTTSSSTALEQVALACGYRTACRAADVGDVVAAMTAALGARGPHMVVVPTGVAPGPAPLRATSELPANQIFRRFAAAMGRAGPVRSRRPG